MAMSKCKKCGNQVSSRAKSCPQCGIVIKKSNKLLIALIIVLGLPFSCCFWSSIFTGGDSTSSSSSSSANNQTQSEILEVRLNYPIGSIIKSRYIRTGPSMNSTNDSTGDLSPREKIYVLEDREEWIRFRVTSQDEGWSAWVQKKYTISEQQLNSQREAKFGKAPTQDSWDNSVKIVKDYLRQIAKDPKSLKFDSWSEVFYNENDGYVVYCVYRGKNSFGGMTGAANWFVIRHGRVVDVKEADAYEF